MQKKMEVDRPRTVFARVGRLPTLMLFGSLVVSPMSMATIGTLLPNNDHRLFVQDFASETNIFKAKGTCGNSATAHACDAMLDPAPGSAQFANGTPVLKFPVSYVDTTVTPNRTVTQIDPHKGTIRFTYTPVGGDWSTPLPTGYDWSGYSPATKVMFRLYDGSRPSRSNLLIGTSYESVTRQNMLVFRYDTTDNCIDNSTSGWGSTGCYHITSTRQHEPGAIMKWDPGVPHTIIATWDLSAGQRYLAISVDGEGIGGYWEPADDNAPIDISTFNPSYFFVGSDGSGTGAGAGHGSTAQGNIANLEIYDLPVLSKTDPITAAQQRTAGDGVWQHYEKYPVPEAPAQLTLGSAFIFYNSYAYEPIFEGSVPSSATEPAGMTIDVVKNQFETQFFNIYTNQNNLGTVKATVSDLTGPDTIGQSQIRIRTVRNSYQAGLDEARDLMNVVYVPELLLNDDTVTPHCGTYGNVLCANMQLPSDPVITNSAGLHETKTSVDAHSSRQFAITLQTLDEQPAGTYTGTITVATQNYGSRTLPLKVVVHDAKLPPIDKIISLYNDNQHTGAGSASYANSTLLGLIMDDMREHGLNGMMYGGQAWSLSDARMYPDLSADHGLTKFAAYPFHANTFPITVPEIAAQPAYLVQAIEDSAVAKQSEGAEFEPYLYGVDEPSPSSSNWANHLAKSKVIHDAGGKVVVAISKGPANLLTANNPISLGGIDYTADDIKLDLPNLMAEARDDTTYQYFVELLSGTGSKSNHPELYYWQMYREEPRINRFYAGYHLYLTDLAGVMPFTHQSIQSDPFNDFDKNSATERDMVTIYPSLQGGIDTIEWEAFRAGLDDYRLLQLWKSLHAQIALQPGNDATAYQSALDLRLGKYRNTQAFDTVSRADYAADRLFLIEQVEKMTNALVDIDEDGVGDAYEHGLTASYYNDTDTTGNGFITDIDEKLVEPSVLQRIDSNIDFYLTGSPEPGVVMSDNFSARWTGRLLVPAYTGTYQFCVTADDGVRMWIDNVDLFSNLHWIPQDSVRSCANVALTAGQAVPIVVEFFDLTEEAILHLSWSWSGHGEEIVPSSNLYAR